MPGVTGYYTHDAVQSSFADITDFVTSIYALEGGVESAALYRNLANLGLADLSKRTQYYRKSWANALSGAFDLAGGASAVYPSDAIFINDAAWDGSGGRSFRHYSESELTARDPDWRSASGTPYGWTSDGRLFVLSSNPGTVADGILVAYGPAQLPKWTTGNETGTSDPITYLPGDEEFSLCPGFYVLKMLPADPEQPVAVARQAQWSAEWERIIVELADLAKRRRLREQGR
jgi:hypothetical protein